MRQALRGRPLSLPVGTVAHQAVGLVELCPTSNRRRIVPAATLSARILSRGCFPPGVLVKAVPCVLVLPCTFLLWRFSAMGVLPRPLVGGKLRSDSSSAVSSESHKTQVFLFIRFSFVASLVLHDTLEGHTAALVGQAEALPGQRKDAPAREGVFVPPTCRTRGRCYVSEQTTMQPSTRVVCRTWRHTCTAMGAMLIRRRTNHMLCCKSLRQARCEKT